jgi:hypothetical protein
MIKLIKKFVFPLFFLISSSAFAGLIADLPKSTYFSQGGYDWTWASPVNVTTQNFGGGFGGGPAFTNTFEDADFHTGWMEFDEIINPDIYALFEALTVGDFTRTDGSIIHSAVYWNSYYTGVDKTQFDMRKGKKNDNLPINNYETFYVRNTPSQVPEPSTIMIFAIAIIALSLRKRAVK